MICNGFTCRKIMVQSVYILSILTGQYVISCMACIFTDSGPENKSDVTERGVSDYTDCNEYLLTHQRRILVT